MARRRTLKTIPEVIKAIGEERAKEIAGVQSRTAPGTWAWRGKLPPETYVAFTAILKRQGYSAPAALWGMHSSV